MEIINVQVNSSSFFRIHMRVWKFLGLAYSEVRWKKLYIAWNIVCHLLITVGYPLHLGISVFRNGNITDDMRNLTFFATCFACSLKFTVYAYNFDKVRQMKELLGLLDARIKTPAELEVYKQLKVQIKGIVYGIIGICVFCIISAELSFLVQTKRALLYPAYFPFDWRQSTLLYYIVNIYQSFGSSYLILENIGNDCFPVVMFCIISGHVKMLYLRLEHIGVDEQARDAQAQLELEACITDHKHLLQLFGTMQSFISLPMLIQISVSALNLCLSVASVLFFVTEPWPRIYFFFYTLAMPLQIFPTCYYGTINELWFGKLHYAAFSCNWLHQTRRFKQELMLFVERSLKKNTAMAGGMLRIHVDTFFLALKFSYSLFTIILRMRK